jgi:two-component system, cell cycle response regulator CpdR
MKRILIAEDNRLERRILSNILTESLGKSVRIDEVSDGNLALQYLEKQHYDLLITDLIMPKLEGIQLIRIINERFPKTKVVAVSGGNPFYLYVAKKIGAEGIFTKPVHKETLIFKISELLGGNVPKPVKI